MLEFLMFFISDNKRHLMAGVLLLFALFAFAQTQQNKTDKRCFISTPPKNKSHFNTGFKYFSILLRYDEQVIFEKMLENSYGKD